MAFNRFHVGKPMNEMTYEEKIAEFEKRISDNLEFTDIAHGRAYVQLCREQMQACTDRHLAKMAAA